MERDIVNQLKRNNIPLKEWGVREAKTVEHLAREILNGEAVLVEESGKIIREIEILYIGIRYTRDGVKLQLIEDRQEFTDGRIRRRGFAGVSEKIKSGEDILAATRRALSEELNIEYGGGNKQYWY